MIDTLIQLLQDRNTQWVLMGTLLLGLASGVLGSFSLLKKQSLIGDAMAHAALPGICLVFIITGEKSILAFMVGAALLGLLASYCIHVITEYSRIKEDTAIGLVLSVFFGIGIVLLTFIAQMNNGNQTGLDDFIFGQAASLVGQDVRMMIFISGSLLVVTFLLFKELKLITFDPQFAKGIGLQVGLLNTLLMILIVGAVVIGLQAVGVVLMSAMLITPAIAARYWTERLDYMVIIAGAIGALSGVLGTLLSAVANRMPTGPLIIVAATIIFIISLVFSPKRGLLTKVIRYYKMRKRTERQQVLQAIYEACERLATREEPFASFILPDVLPNQANKKQRFQKLVRDRLVTKVESDHYRFTNTGLKEAYQIVLNNRLMEVYVMNEMRFAHLQLKSDHTLSFLDLPEKEKTELLKLLEVYNIKPKLIPPALAHGTNRSTVEMNIKKVEKRTMNEEGE
ncbi:metal ABC transporter permease [Bacillus salitolerans]|uniref:Metal ABC transporter permease n=1 Tax=Bacillus salitolerans TaxID=1437434 RepID=A0ABW4LYH0_9BACI